MASEFDLYVDITSNKLVNGLNSKDTFVFGQFFQGSVLKLKITPVTPTNSAARPFYSKVTLTNLNLKVAVGVRAGSPTLYANQYTWTKVYDAGASTGYFSADLTLNTNELNTAIGSSSELSTAFFEIQLSEDGLYRTVYQTGITILASVIDPSGSAVPTPQTNYLTREECIEMFVRWSNNASGKIIDLVSPDGASHRLIGVNNDKSAKDDLL